MAKELSNNINKVNEYLQELKAVGENIKAVSDTHHTFQELYDERVALFCALCNTSPQSAWKAKKHFAEETDPMYGGCFICGLNTPEGIVSFHFKMKHWADFKIPELDRAPQYEGYTSKEVISRLKKFNKGR